MDVIPSGLAEIERRFRGAIAETVGIDLACFDRPGTSVVSSIERKGLRTASVHAIGQHSLIWTDPGVIDRVEGLASDTDSFPVNAAEAWASANDATFLGGAWSFLIAPAMLSGLAPPDCGVFVRLNRDHPSDRALIQALVDVSDPGDLEAAEITMEALDPQILGLTDDEGRLAAFVSERPWDYDPGFGNIAVLVRADKRRGGWGTAVVTALCRDILERARLPLYRSNWDREPSRSLALSVGFRQATSVAAVRFD